MLFDRFELFFFDLAFGEFLERRLHLVPSHSGCLPAS